jgi:hypothetical protein
MLNFNQWLNHINENTDAVSTVDKNNLTAVLSASGYAVGSAPFEIAKIIATKEGWASKPNGGKGTRAYRNNNPGNLDGTDFKDIDPAVTVETMLDGTKGRYAKFSKPELGAKALIDKKIIKWANGGMPTTSGNQTLIVSSKGGKKYIKGEKPTVAQFFYTYAPPNENDTEGYIRGFITAAKKLKADATRDTLVADLLS